MKIINSCGVLVENFLEKFFERGVFSKNLFQIWKNKMLNKKNVKLGIQDVATQMLI